MHSAECKHKGPLFCIASILATASHDALASNPFLPFAPRLEECHSVQQRMRVPLLVLHKDVVHLGVDVARLLNLLCQLGLRVW